MATQNVILRESGYSPNDLSAKQYYFVKVNEKAEIEVASTNEHAYVLEDQPKAKQYGTYCVLGKSKALTAEEIKGGEAISTNSEGKAVKATATKIGSEKVETEGTAIVGYALAKAESGSLVPFITASGRA